MLKPLMAKISKKYDYGRTTTATSVKEKRKSR